MSTENAATKVVIGKVRFSYCNVWEPTAMEEGQEKKYNVTLMVPKSDKKSVAAIEAAIEEAKKIGAKTKAKWGGKIPKNLEISFKDGDDTDKPEYEGHYIIAAKSSTQPGVYDKNRQPIVNKDEVYSGAYGYASVNWYPYDKGKNGVAASLNAVMKTQDGERFGFVPTADDFADLAVTDDEDDDII